MTPTTATPDHVTPRSGLSAAKLSVAGIVAPRTKLGIEVAAVARMRVTDHRRAERRRLQLEAHLLQRHAVLRQPGRIDQRALHAVDVVELAPIPGLSAPDFLVAKLIYKMIGYQFAQG